MNYSINVSLNGRFYFEVNRLSDGITRNTDSLVEFVGKLRDNYPESDGYKVEVSQRIGSSKRLDI